MSQFWYCPNGHQWQPHGDGASTSLPRRDTCPVCGASVEITPPTQAGDTGPRTMTAGAVTQGFADNLDFEVGEAASDHPVVTGYELLGKLGSGGMGVVYKARQLGLNRIVALKMIRAGAQATPAERARFRVEAEAVARLQHPHIVQVYEVGEQDGCPYFSLEFVEGGSLDRKLAGTPLAAARAGELVETLAQAIHAAHQRGIIHRDLKPANVLLGDGGRPKITDFGLAKQTDALGDTHSGHILGTPCYMAPEQASGQTREVGPATDVYALGAILYELLTGRPPFKGTTLLDTLEQVRSQEPVPPSRLQPKVPRDLETICLKCLEKEPPKRYGGADQLAGDLRRFLEGRPVLARPISAWERAARWVRRRPAVAALVGTSVAALIALFAVVLLSNRVLQRERDHADEQREVATRARVELDAQRLRAEKSYVQARKAVDDFVSRVSDRLSDAPGLQPLNRELLEDALRYYEEFLQERGDDPALRRDLAKAYHHMAVLQHASGDLPAALRSYERARDLREQLAREGPGDVEFRRDLAASYHNLAAVQAALGQPADALRSYEQARAVREQLVRNRPAAREFQRDLARTQVSLGNLQGQGGQTAPALHSYRQAIDLQGKLVQADPANQGYQRDLAGSYNHLGDLQRESGQASEALVSYQQARDGLEKLLVKHNPKAQDYLDTENQLGRIWNDTGLTLEQLRRPAEALAAFQQAVDHERVAASSGKTSKTAQYRHYLGDHFLNLARVERALGRPAEAAAVILEHKRFGRSPTELYRVACELALCIPVTGTTQPTDEEQAERRRYGEQAVEALRQAIGNGFRDIDRLRKDPDLEPLRSRDDFKKLLNALEEKVKSGPDPAPSHG